MNLLSQNAKIRKTGKKHSVRLFNWGIPASARTCPMAGDCAQGCYAKQGAYVWSNVQPAYRRRLDASLRDDFVTRMVAEIRRRRVEVLRIHDSGDFYSLGYTLKWIAIMQQCPDVRFYAYTKMVPMFKRLKRENKLPSNFTVIYSYGGKADHLIDPARDRHAAVFPDNETLSAAGYTNASDDDLVAAFGDNHRIGLIYHGAKTKEWKASA